MGNIFKYFTIALTTIMVIACNDDQIDFQLTSEFNEIVNKYTTLGNCNDTVASDLIIYPTPWTKEVLDTFSISEAKIKNTSTCGLIQSYFYQPWNVLGPWCSTCSDFSMDGIQHFNSRTEKNDVLNELFSRKYALRKLTATYIGFIQNLNSIENHPGRLHSYEILLSSRKMDNIHEKNADIEFIVLCLKMIEEKKESSEFNNQNSIAITRHIIVDMLIRNEFEPFLSNYYINGILERNLNGYAVCYENEKVEYYAKLYLEN